ncbi:MAG: hypothetical protein LUC30_07370 [Clostridiales bacterium]|nr:hypothetical protein [Clostridiales bacterium]
MTNREKYKQAFSVLHADGDVRLEKEPKETGRKDKTVLWQRVAAACACAALIFGGAGTAYATDLGGVRTALTAWISGRQVEVEVADGEDGVYTFTYEAEDGTEQVFGGEGVVMDENGNETPASPEEILDGMGIGIEEAEDGSVWLYYYDRAVEITEYLTDDEDVCRVALEANGETVYFDIRYNGDMGYELQSALEPDGAAEDYTVIG